MSTPPSARPRIVVVGSTNIDLTFQAPRLPRAGETLAGSGFHLGFGGKGANQAVMAARLGASVDMVSCVGADAFGEQALRNYREHGVAVGHVRTEPGQPTGVAGIVVGEQAQNCIVVVAGANGALSADDVRRAEPVLRESAVLLCQLEVPVEAVHEALRRGRAAGVRTVLNPAPALPLADELLALADLCVPNETELEALTGLPVDSLEAVETAARRLLGRGPGAVLVTLGERGALLVSRGAAEHFPAHPVQALDPTGAGDAFIGSLAVFLAEGRGLADGIRAAAAAAALSVRRPGAQASFPTRAEVEAVLAGKR